MRYQQISALILAGGRSSRMGGEDKGLIPFNGKAMITYVIAALESRLDKIFINANRNLEQYRDFGYPVISDESRDFNGPLAGFLAGMTVVDTTDILVVPCDSPQLSTALIDRLVDHKQKHQADIAVAHDGKRLQPVYALLSVSLKDSLQDFLARGERKIDLWYPQHKVVEVDCSDMPEIFININTREELHKLEQSRRTA